MAREQRIDPDINLGDEELTRVARLIAESAARASITYHEDGKDTRTWFAGIGAVLLTAFIIGGWALSNQLSALQQRVVDLTAEVTDLKKLVEPRYRGGSE